MQRRRMATSWSVVVHGSVNVQRFATLRRVLLVKQRQHAWKYQEVAEQSSRHGDARQEAKEIRRSEGTENENTETKNQ